MFDFKINFLFGDIIFEQHFIRNEQQLSQLISRSLQELNAQSQLTSSPSGYLAKTASLDG